MPVVRYAALAALVFWLGGMAQALGAGGWGSLTQVGLASGAVMLVALFVMKFVGPPPHEFIPRAGIVVTMLLLTAATLLVGPSRAVLGTTFVLGLVLLSWYARE